MKRSILFAAALALVAGSASAENQLVISQEKAGNAGAALGVDFVSDGEAVGFEALIDVGTSAKGAVDLSKCLANVPKSHQGNCVQTGTKVKVIVYSLNSAKFPAGVVSVGQIGVRAKGAAAKVDQVLVSDSNGNPLSVTGNVE